MLHRFINNLRNTRFLCVLLNLILVRASRYRYDWALRTYFHSAVEIVISQRPFPVRLRCSNEFSKLESVHLWHLDVSQDQLDRTRAALLLKTSLIESERLFATLEARDYDFEVLEQDRAKRNQVELLII